MWFGRSIGWCGLLLTMACGSSSGILPDSREGADAPVPDAPAPAPDAGPGELVIVDAPDNGSAIGYAAVGVPPTFEFANLGAEPTCRAGHVPEVDGLAFAPCPGALPDGSLSYLLPITPDKPDGLYRIEIHYVDADGQAREYTLEFYLHRTLTGAAACGSAADASWPTNDEFFAAATAEFTLPAGLLDLPPWIDEATRTGSMTHTGSFAGADMTAPTYALPFTDVLFRYPAYLGSGADGTPTLDALAAGTPVSFELPILSLRHRLELSADQTLLIVQRRYESLIASRESAEHRCAMRIPFGAGTHGQARPVPYECDALVLNAAGEGFCMQVVDGQPVPAVYSRQLVSKLMDENVVEVTPFETLQRPVANRGGIWGPKVFDDVGAYSIDDDYTGDRAKTIILRP